MYFLIILYEHSTKKAGKIGIAFIAINLKTKYVVTNKDKSRTVHHIPLSSDKEVPPRHTFLCFFMVEKKETRLVIFDPMTKTHSNRENNRGIWSISVLKNLYYSLLKPTVSVRHGSSRGSDCLWQSLRQLDRIIHDQERFRQFLIQD